MPGRRRAPQKATKCTSTLAAENDRLQRELEWPARSWPSETRATPPRDLAQIDEELSTALEELRELARGIHPAILSERGLPDSLEMLAIRSPVPVEIEQAPGERLSEQVEAAIYYVVAEALTNVAK